MQNLTDAGFDAIVNLKAGRWRHLLCARSGISWRARYLRRNAGNEISRRLGECGGLFRQIRQVWSHAAVTRNPKLEVYPACVLSKLLYSLESLWLLKPERARLDAFHCRCLRVILRIPCSYVSRISNAVVLERAGMHPLSETLLSRQKAPYLKIKRQEHTSILRHLIMDETGGPRVWCGARRRGRPRQRWAREVHKLLNS